MYIHRIEKLRELLKEKDLDAVVVSSVSNIFYLTGISHFSKEEREAYLLITKTNAYFFTTSLYVEEVQKRVTGFEIQRIGRDEPFVKLLKAICEKETLGNIGFEEHDIRYFEYFWMQKGTKQLTPLSLNIRMEKDAMEIEKIQKACDMGDKAFAYAVKQVKLGVSEKDIVTAIELFLKQHNADISFRPIVAFGENTSMPHYESSPDRVLQPKEPILIDMGAKVDGYCSDMTRTFFFGEPTEKQREIYQIVLESQQKAIAYIMSSLQDSGSPKRTSLLQEGAAGMTASNVDKIARDYIISKGYPTIPHSLGHGIGIDVHESPRLSPSSDETLKNGMVFSLEPGIYLQNDMGVRIEDLAVIENLPDGRQAKLRILTLSKRELVVL